MEPQAAWLSYEDVPLKWHYPLGLLYDLYAGAEPHYPGSPKDSAEGSEDHDEVRDDAGLPWKLTVHFSDYPKDQMIQLDAGGKHLHDLYINSVKEVSALRPGSSPAFFGFTLRRLCNDIG